MINYVNRIEVEISECLQTYKQLTSNQITDSVESVNISISIPIDITIGLKTIQDIFNQHNIKDFFNKEINSHKNINQKS